MIGFPPVLRASALLYATNFFGLCNIIPDTKALKASSLKKKNQTFQATTYPKETFSLPFCSSSICTFCSLSSRRVYSSLLTANDNLLVEILFLQPLLSSMWVYSICFYFGGFSIFIRYILSNCLYSELWSRAVSDLSLSGLNDMEKHNSFCHFAQSFSLLLDPRGSIQAFLSCIWTRKTARSLA